MLFQKKNECSWEAQRLKSLVSIKDVHRRQKLTKIFLKLYELTILVVTISISIKIYAYHGFWEVIFSKKGFDNKIIGFLHI